MTNAAHVAKCMCLDTEDPQQFTRTENGACVVQHVHDTALKLGLCGLSVSVAQTWHIRLAYFFAFLCVTVWQVCVIAGDLVAFWYCLPVHVSQWCGV